MTQAELAEVLGTHAASISQVERGIRGLSLQQVVKLSRALRVATDDLLGEKRRVKEPTQIMNPRLLRRLHRIDELPAAERRAVLKILDGLLDRHGRGNGHR
jgi:transcriptional regulator with XRE-family HTH domain